MAKQRVPKAVKAYLAKIGRKAAPSGGRARQALLSPAERTALARKAASARWSK
jgi:hypothetical protein